MDKIYLPIFNYRSKLRPHTSTCMQVSPSSYFLYTFHDNNIVDTRCCDELMAKKYNDV